MSSALKISIMGGLLKMRSSMLRCAGHMTQRNSTLKNAFSVNLFLKRLVRISIHVLPVARGCPPFSNNLRMPCPCYRAPGKKVRACPHLCLAPSSNGCARTSFFTASNKKLSVHLPPSWVKRQPADGATTIPHTMRSQRTTTAASILRATTNLFKTWCDHPLRR